MLVEEVDTALQLYLALLAVVVAVEVMEELLVRVQHLEVVIALVVAEAQVVQDPQLQVEAVVVE